MEKSMTSHPLESLKMAATSVLPSLIMNDKGKACKKSSFKNIPHKVPSKALTLGNNNSKYEEFCEKSSLLSKKENVCKNKDHSSLVSSKRKEDSSDSEPDDSDQKDLKAISVEIPEVLRKQGTASFCSSNANSTCPCNTLEAVEQTSKQISYCDRRNWISIDRLNELRKRAQEAIKNHRTFTIRGCFFSIRNALSARGWVEKLDIHRKNAPSGVCTVTYEDLTQTLPKRRPGESRRQYLIKCERNIMSRFLEHVPIDFLWTARKEKCDWIDQTKNPSMIINKFHRAPFTSKEGLCAQLRDFHWFFEEGLSDIYFPRCYNVWSPEELSEFTENYRMTACISFLKYLVETYKNFGWDNVFSQSAKIPLTAIDFAIKRCNEFIDFCKHNDIDIEEQIRIWEHDWDAFLTNHYLLTHEQSRIQSDPNKPIDNIIRTAERILDNIKPFWPQYGSDGYLNIWIVKPANKCRGRGIHLMNNIKKIMSMVNPPIASKSRYVVQKYLERPLVIHNTKFDIRQWFLITSVQPLIIWMYRESYLRFSSQEYNLQNYHESVHLTNHAVQKKYRNAKRDERLPTENMWDCYTFQAYLRQIGQQEMWNERIYPGMRKAIIGAMLASQESMDRRINTFELFGADFMISEDFYPWLIEINSSPDLGATTSVTARMCPQCLEDTIKVIIDKKLDIKADTGNFEMIYRQSIPPTPAYMGLNLFLKGKQLMPKASFLRKERSIMPQCHHRIQTPHGQQQTLLSVPTYSPIFSLDQSQTASSKIPIIVDLFNELVLPESNTSFKMGDNVKLERGKPDFSLGSNSESLLRCGTSPNLNRSEQTTMSYSLPRPFTQNSCLSFTKLGHERKLNSESFALKFGDFLHPYSKRYFSCSPHFISATDTVEVGHVQDNLDENVENSLACIGSKCNSDSLIANELNSRVKINPYDENVQLAKTKIYNLKQKPKSAKTQRTSRASAKDRLSEALKSSPVERRHSSFSRQKKTTDERIVKPTPVKSSNEEYLASPFYAVGMSLRAWRSRQHKVWKAGNKTTSLLPYRNVQRRSPSLHSPKRQLCKNISKKMEDRAIRSHTGC